MPADILGKHARRPCPRCLVGCLPQRPVALQRELGVDGDRTGRLRQTQQAVDAGAVAERHLKGVGGRRQHGAHQIVQLDLAERAARLLVREDLGEAADLQSQLADALAGRIDHRQALVEDTQVLGGPLGLLEEAVADPPAESVDPLVEAAMSLVEAAGQLGLGERQPIGHFADAGQLHRRLAARPLAAQHQDDEREEHGHGKTGGERREERRRRRSHRRTIARKGLPSTASLHEPPGRRKLPQSGKASVRRKRACASSFSLRPSDRVVARLDRARRRGGRPRLQPQPVAGDRLCRRHGAHP